MIGFIIPICFVFVASLSSTLAVGPCNEELVSKLSKIAECYSGGKVPKLTHNSFGDMLQSSGEVGTHIVWTKDDFPAGVKCVTAYQNNQHSYVNYFLNNGSNVPVTVDFQEKENYLMETGESLKGKTYRLYVIINESFVYGYYRCVEGTGQSGTHQVNVAINCKYTKDEGSLLVVKRAKTCFSKLGIQNVIDVAPCSTEQCT